MQITGNNENICMLCQQKRGISKSPKAPQPARSSSCSRVSNRSAFLLFFPPLTKRVHAGNANYTLIYCSGFIPSLSLSSAVLRVQPNHSATSGFNYSAEMPDSIVLLSFASHLSLIALCQVHKFGVQPLVRN